jgi:hypothetical protein
MKSKTANGEVGYLIYCHATDRHMFRVYDAQHNFVDYDIRHNDLRVKIIDPDAHFYTGQANGEQFYELDHCPATLGIE